MEEPSAPIPLPPKLASKTPILLIVLAVALMVAICWLAVQAALERTRRAYCCNNLMQSGLALLMYESVHGAFPPAASTDKRGKPMMSWRVAILPYLGRTDLYEQYDRDQPWDSPRNRAVGNTALRLFRCPSDPGGTTNPTETNYVRIVGKDTVGGTPNERVSLRDITDGSDNTILVVEVSGLHINWEEPRDVTVEEFMEIVSKSATQGRASPHPGGFNAIMASGRVCFIKNTIDPKTLRSLLLRNDGQPVGDFESLP